MICLKHGFSIRPLTSAVSRIAGGFRCGTTGPPRPDIASPVTEQPRRLRRKAIGSRCLMRSVRRRPHSRVRFIPNGRATTSGAPIAEMAMPLSLCYEPMTAPIGILTSIATKLLARGEFEQPPVDIEKVALAVGITEIRRAKLGPTSGSLIRSGRRAVVVLNEEQSLTRQRFTLAHEIGHFVFHSDHADRGGRWDRRPKSSLEMVLEERECDGLAAELLMPAEDFLDCIVRDAPDICHIESVAKAFEVSVESAALRYARFSRARAQFVAWRPNRGVLGVAWSAGLGRYLDRAKLLPISDRSSSAVNAHLTSSKQLGYETTLLHGKFVRYRAQSKAFGSQRNPYVLSIVRGPAIPLNRVSKLKGPRRP